MSRYFLAIRKYSPKCGTESKLCPSQNNTLGAGGNSFNGKKVGPAPSLVKTLTPDRDEDENRLNGLETNDATNNRRNSLLRMRIIHFLLL